LKARIPPGTKEFIMADPFFGEIRVMANTFAPYNWAFCWGQSMQIGQNNALYAVIGTAFGGDGKTTYNLPDFRAAAPIGTGAGPGLTPCKVGQYSGVADVTLTSSQMSSHTHTLSGLNVLGEKSAPDTNLYLAVDQGNTTSENIFYMEPATIVPDTTMDERSIGSSGGGQSHPNIQPYLTMNFCICLYGDFPMRN
jgi:microcystin-dependent protein